MVKISGEMGQHVTRFLFGSVLVCIVLYLSQEFKSGNYVKSFIESFALTNETQATSGASQTEKVASFDDPLTSEEDHKVNETMVSNATLNEADDPYKELKEVLRKAANEDNTVILTVINRAFAAPGSLLDMFLESFHVGENIEHMLKHLVFVAMDQNAYERCKSIHPYCYFLKIEGVDYNNEERFMTRNYVQLGWDRNMFQLKILELGFNFLFTDVDMVWFRNPFRYISMAADIAVACDIFSGDQYDMNSDINTGFVFVKSCNKTIEFYKIWQNEGRERFKDTFEQDAINRMKAELVSRTNVQMQFLDTKYIGNFCQLRSDLNKMCTLHVACCVGLDNKYHDLKVAFDDWKNFTAKSVDERRSEEFHWTGPEKCAPWIRA